MVNGVSSKLGLETLATTHSIFLELLNNKTASDEVGLNQFGEMAMRIDVAAEDVVIKSLQDYSFRYGQGIHVISEEHGGV